MTILEEIDKQMRSVAEYMLQMNQMYGQGFVFIMKTEGGDAYALTLSKVEEEKPEEEE